MYDASRDTILELTGQIRTTTISLFSGKRYFFSKDFTLCIQHLQWTVWRICVLFLSIWSCNDLKVPAKTICMLYCSPLGRDIYMLRSQFWHWQWNFDTLCCENDTNDVQLPGMGLNSLQYRVWAWQKCFFEDETHTEKEQRPGNI